MQGKKVKVHFSNGTFIVGRVTSTTKSSFFKLQWIELVGEKKNSVAINLDHVAYIVDLQK